MAVQRVEWVCPGCERAFAIPAGAARPQLCPKCVAAAPAPEEVEPGEPPAFAPRQTDSVATTVKRQKYPALRLVSLLCKVESVLVAVVTLAAVIAGVVRLLGTDDSQERTALAIFTGSFLLGGTFLALVQWAVAELVLVLLDIEENTRVRMPDAQ